MCGPVFEIVKRKIIQEHNEYLAVQLKSETIDEGALADFKDAFYNAASKLEFEFRDPATIGNKQTWQ